MNRYSEIYPNISNHILNNGVIQRTRTGAKILVHDTITLKIVLNELDLPISDMYISENYDNLQSFISAISATLDEVISKVNYSDAMIDDLNNELFKIIVVNNGASLVLTFDNLVVADLQEWLLVYSLIFIWICKRNNLHPVSATVLMLKPYIYATEKIRKFPTQLSQYSLDIPSSSVYSLCDLPKYIVKEST